MGFSLPIAVFSTNVEVFLRQLELLLIMVSFLHARGGVSSCTYHLQKQNRFSPRTWRCFLISGEGTVRHDVFSTHVEVFLSPCSSKALPGSFLHARGGVSDAPVDLRLTKPFSPRTWRCFWAMTQGYLTSFVFSTHVEVFLLRLLFKDLRNSFLHARGGVSDL